MRLFLITFYQKLTIPASVKDGNTPLLRRLIPESPQEWMILLLLRLCLSRIHSEAPGIHGLNQMIDLRSLSCTAKSLEYDHDRNITAF